MICPLCKSEYREGVTTCNDCHVPLMITSEQAHNLPVRTPWEGADEKALNQFMAALDDACVPFTSELRGGPDQMGSVILAFVLRFIFWRFNLFKGYAERQKGWRIKVLPSDYSRAQKIAANLQHNAELERE
jgi:hypothetical protein